MTSSKPSLWMKIFSLVRVPAASALDRQLFGAAGPCDRQHIFSYREHCIARTYIALFMKVMTLQVIRSISHHIFTLGRYDQKGIAINVTEKQPEVGRCSMNFFSRHFTAKLD